MFLIYGGSFVSCGCSGFRFSGHKHIWSEVEIYWFQALILVFNWLSFILDYGSWKRKNWKVIYGKYTIRSYFAITRTHKPYTIILFRINSRNNRDNKHNPKNMQIKITKAKSYLFSPVIFLLFFCLKSCNFDLNRLRPRTKAYSLISSNSWHLTQNGNYLVDDCGIIANHYGGHLS